MKNSNHYRKYFGFLAVCILSITLLLFLSCDKEKDLFHGDLIINNFNEATAIPNSIVRTIAIIDSGISSSLLSKYSDKIIMPYNAIDESTNVEDYFGHGSSIFCIISCSTELDGVEGLSQQSYIMLIKAFDEIGKTSIEYLVRALSYAIDKNVDIINLSFGSFANNHEIDKLLERAERSNIIVVAPLLTNEKNELSFPGLVDSVFSVAQLQSINNNDLINSRADAFVYYEGILTIDIHFGNKVVLRDGISLSCAIVSSYLANKK